MLAINEKKINEIYDVKVIGKSWWDEAPLIDELRLETRNPDW